MLKMTTNTRRFAWAAGIMSSVIVAFAAWQSHVHASPEYALRIVQEINSQADLDTRKEFVTAKGYKVATACIQAKDGPSDQPQLTIGPARVEGDKCYFAFSQKDGAGFFCFEHDGRWKFDDVLFTKLHGREMELSLSYTIDHPYRAALQMMDWKEMWKAFLVGAEIGAAIGSSGS
ncbi:MAG TPA: hypothetical protein VGG64_28445 [Pirellulales bacterium]|jgi:hypothetical protein